jgi:hypothetical protein
MERDFEQIGPKYRAYLAFDPKTRIATMKHAIKQNQAMLRQLASSYLPLFKQFTMVIKTLLQSSPTEKCN